MNRPELRPPDLHRYEARQNYNVLTRLLHGNRYRHLLAIARDLAAGRTEPLRVVDIGCGTAAAYKLLQDRIDLRYCGIELRRDFAELAQARYGTEPGFEVVNVSVTDAYDRLDGADLIIALDTLEHIPEPIVVRVVETIAARRPSVFYCTVPNEVGPAIAIKNVGSFLMGYQRYREYSWRETFFASIYDLDRVGVHRTAHKGFDWRWLAQTLRQNMQIRRTLTSPAPWVPRCVSPSIGFVCAPRGEDPAPAPR